MHQTPSYARRLPVTFVLVLLALRGGGIPRLPAARTQHAGQGILEPTGALPMRRLRLLLT